MRFTPGCRCCATAIPSCTCSDFVYTIRCSPEWAALHDACDGGAVSPDIGDLVLTLPSFHPCGSGSYTLEYIGNTCGAGALACCTWAGDDGSVHTYTVRILGNLIWIVFDGAGDRYEKTISGTVFDLLGGETLTWVSGPETCGGSGSTVDVRHA